MNLARTPVWRHSGSEAGWDQDRSGSRGGGGCARMSPDHESRKVEPDALSRSVKTARSSKMKTPMRHGVAVLLVLLLCASLFLVYNGSFNSPSRETNDTRVRQHEHLQQPPEACGTAAKPHLPALQGYIGIIDHKPLRMHCHTCSLITSSGHLIGGRRGKEIDRAECVIRMNDAPTAGAFGQDVGRRTSLRVIAHSSMQRVLRSRHELLNASQDTVFIFWGPSSYMRRDGKGLVYNNLRLMNQVLPKLKVYMISWQKMLQFDELFKKETGKDRKISNSWLSTGWFTMTIALELCDRINVFGMVAPDFCREPQHQSVPYHYYEPRGPDECAMYISHERGKRGSHHRFITEKRAFANWARTFDIHFFQPDWSPPPLPDNRTLPGTAAAAVLQTT